MRKIMMKVDYRVQQYEWLLTKNLIGLKLFFSSSKKMVLGWVDVKVVF